MDQLILVSLTINFFLIFSLNFEIIENMFYLRCSLVKQINAIIPEQDATTGNLLTKETIIIICPIAIAYSMGQSIISVCVCHCVSVYIRASASTLTVAFHQN